MYYTYILVNANHTVFYTGVTRNIIRRTYEHKSEFVYSFTQRFNIKKLVYYEAYPDIWQALAREKQLKKWKRAWKERLINNFNPHWNDLCEELGISLE